MQGWSSCYYLTLYLSPTDAFFISHVLFDYLALMAGKKQYKPLEESEYIRDIAKIMAEGKGPWTRLMLMEKLSIIYPKAYKQDLMNIISSAIFDDRRINKRFGIAKPGWWDLKERIDQGTKS